MIKDGTGVFYWKWDSLPGKNMRPGVSRLLKLCVLGEFYARFSQDAQVNETVIIFTCSKTKKKQKKKPTPSHKIIEKKGMEGKKKERGKRLFTIYRLMD